MTTSDTHLLRRCLERDDRAALDDLFGRHYPAVYRTALKLVHGEADANDVAQSTFLAAIRAGRTAPPSGSLRAWLLAIAINEARQLHRREARRKDDWLFDVYVEAEQAPGAPETASRREFERALEDALQDLPQPLKEPLVLHYYEGLPLATVGEVLGLAKSTVQSRVVHAVRRLRREFERRGHVALLPLLELELPAAPPAGAWTSASALTGALSMKPTIVLVAIAVAIITAWSATALLGTPARPAEQAPGVARTASPSHDSRGHAHPTGEDPGEQEVRRVAVTPGSPRVFGQVVDPKGAPIPNASLSLYDYAGDRVLTAVSGADGRYGFPETSGHHGTFHLVIERSGHGRRTAPEVRATQEPRRDVLAVEHVILGRVVSAPDDAPVTSFRVKAVRLPFQSDDEWDTLTALRRQAVPTALSIDREVDVADVDGAFRIEGLGAGRYTLLVAAPDRQPSFFNGGGRTWDRYRGIEAREATEAEEQLIRLPPTGRAWVEAIDRATGQPVLDATIATAVDVGRKSFLFPRRCADAGARRISVPVELDGRGKIRDFDFVVSAPGYAPFEMATSGHDDEHTLTVALARAASVRGSVRDENGAPVVGAAILIERGYDEALLAIAHTNAFGVFGIDGLDARSASTLRCLDATHRSVLGTARLTLEDGRMTTVDLGSAAAISIRGTVCVRGEPRRDAIVQLTREDDPSVSCTTSENGGFAFDLLEPGRHELIVSTSVAEHPIRTERVVEVGTADRLRIDLDFDCTIDVIAIDTTTGEPVTADADFDVVARPVGTADRAQRTWSDDDGRFRLVVAEARPYELTVENSEQWFSVAPVRVDPASAHATPVELRVTRDPGDGIIALQIVDAVSRRPVATGGIRHAHGTMRGAAAFAEGTFTVSPASLGVHRFTITSDAHRPSTLSIALEPTERRVERLVELERAAVVIISSVEPAGPAYRAGVRAGDTIVRYGDTEVHSVVGLRTALADARGPVPLVVERDGIRITFGVPSGRLGIRIENVR